MGDIVAAIDLGTSRTAYSYVVGNEGDKKRVHLGVPDRPGDAGIGLERKTATAVLLESPNRDSGGWRLRTFGDRAEKEYLLDTMVDDGGTKLALFKRFKMELYRGGRSGVRGRKVDDVLVLATDNKTLLPLAYVISLVLGYLKDRIIKRLNQDDLTTIRPSDIRWVLTVPAIWSEFGKIFMRNAACRAGLIANEQDYENLSLCLEPEAACLSVEVNAMQPWEVGEKLMVLDCGGGTIDITTHHVRSTSPLKLEELQQPTGGPWGSTAADDKFKTFIKDLLQCSKATWEILDASAGMLSLMQDWEEKKTDFQPGQDIRLRMDDVLEVIDMDVRTFEATVNKEIDSSEKQQEVRATKRVLTIGAEKVGSFFEDAFAAILRTTKNILKKQPEISAIYMVGGFSSNPLLQKKVADGVGELHREVKVVFPPRPGLAIVIGAALHGDKGTSIVSRKARLTYGTRANTEYDEENPEHRQRKRDVKTLQGKMYIETFYGFVESGEDLPVGTEREHTFSPLTDDQKLMSFPISVSKRPAADVMYLKDAGVDRKLSTIITVEVPVDRKVRFSDRGVSVRLLFGGTELRIFGKRCSDGHEVPAQTIVVENMDEDTDEAMA